MGEATEAAPSGTSSYAADLELAHEMADIAADIAMAHFLKARTRVKADRSLVTEADLAVERALADLLGRERPDDGLLAEELHQDTAGPRRMWVVDPIDHTNNYARGHRAFATLIALVEEGRPVVGVIAAPALRQRWWGARGLGAWADGEPMRVSSVDDVADAHLSFSQIEAWRELGRLEQLADLAGAVRWTFGSGGWLGQMGVADGTFDIALDSTGHVWDLAASQIIVEEAGGVFSDVEGRPSPDRGTAVVCNPRLHAEVLRRLARPAPASPEAR
ncbi:inositol monophosphatase family protein [Streptomyces sp. NPDC003717]|uniref:inositol monophosphatase family protein n=1 Tax=Streptomyces sp. NPDC003717 TaxID=3154276 RepID=UPI0033BA457B